MWDVRHQERMLLLLLLLLMHAVSTTWMTPLSLSY
jgi:hypothetical protein